MQQAVENQVRVRSFRQLFRRWRTNREGVAAIEFAFCALPFFALIFAIIETGIILTAGIVLENGVHTLGRQILTGQLHQGEKLPTKDEFSDLVCDRVSYLLACDKLQIDLRTFASFDQIALAYDPDDFQYDMGEGDEISVLRVYYKWSWMTSYLHGLSEETDGTVLLSSVTAFQNEPFPCPTACN